MSAGWQPEKNKAPSWGWLLGREFGLFVKVRQVPLELF
jgi:hypothetical protein